jgi:cell division protein FtsB
MARATRSPRSDSSGPGRSQQRRTRTAARPNKPAAKKAAPEPSQPKWQRGIKLTRRALALAAVVIVLAVSFGGTLQVYFTQQRDLAVAEQEIRERNIQIADLETELARWSDPAYVKAQARERLGWVMPGESGYRVVDDNGNPVGGGVTLESAQRPVSGEGDRTWWQRLNGALATADSPVRQVAPR